MRAEIAPARRARPSAPLLGAIAPRAAPDNATTVAARGTALHPAGRPVACWFAHRPFARPWGKWPVGN
jgi:hypothetical protein